MKVTFEVLAESILEDMIQNIIKNQTFELYSNCKTVTSMVQQPYAFLVEKHGANSDIYKQDKMKLKNSDTNTYFTCENCGRNISGGRFAQHINKCLERKRR